MSISDLRMQQYFEMRYANFEAVADSTIVAPMARAIQTKTPDAGLMQVGIEYNRLELGKTQNVEFDIPKEYRRTTP